MSFEKANKRVVELIQRRQFAPSKRGRVRAFIELREKVREVSKIIKDTEPPKVNKRVIFRLARPG